jgi:hypothetical protein
MMQSSVMLVLLMANALGLICAGSARAQQSRCPGVSAMKEDGTFYVAVDDGDGSGPTPLIEGLGPIISPDCGLIALGVGSVLRNFDAVIGYR